MNIRSALSFMDVFSLFWQQYDQHKIFIASSRQTIATFITSYKACILVHSFTERSRTKSAYYETCNREYCRGFHVKNGVSYQLLKTHAY